MPRKVKPSRKRGAPGVQPPASAFRGPDMAGWTVEQMASAVYSQLFLISLSLTRVATVLLEIEERRELRSESSHPNDSRWAASIDATAQRDKKETFTPRNDSAIHENGFVQQPLFSADASRVRPKRGRSNAGSGKPVNFDGREPTERQCEEADTTAGFGNPVIREDLLEPDAER